MSWEFENKITAGFNYSSPISYSTCLNGDYKYSTSDEVVDDITTYHIRFYTLTGRWNEVFDIVHPHHIVSTSISKNGKSLVVYDTNTVNNVTTYTVTVYTKLTTNWLDRVDTFTYTGPASKLTMSADGNTIVALVNNTLITHKYDGAWVMNSFAPSSPFLTLSISGDGNTIVAKHSASAAITYRFNDVTSMWVSMGVLQPVDNAGNSAAFAAIIDCRVREDGNAVFVYNAAAAPNYIGSRSFSRQHNTFIPSAIPMEANLTNGALLWSGRDCWSFITSSNQLAASTTNPWEPANAAENHTNEAEKLSYHFYFDNNTFGAVTRGCETSEVPNTWSLRGASAAIYGNSILASHHIDILRWDTETRTYTGVVATLPTIDTDVVIHCEGAYAKHEQLTPQSNICVVKDRLFIATRQLTADSQNRLAVFDLVAKTWTFVILPGKHMGIDARHIVYGLDNFIWITSKNDHSIIKVDVDTLAVTATIRINRHPYRMMVNQAKDLYVASDASPDPVLRKDYLPELNSTMLGTSGGGLIPTGQAAFKIKETVDTTDGQISVVNQVNNEQSAFGAARCNGVKHLQGYTLNNDFYDDGQGYLWFLTDAHIGRMRKSDKEYKTSFTSEDGESDTIPEYNMIPDNSELTPAIGAVATLVSPAFSYEQWNGSTFVTVNVKPYLFAMQSGGSLEIRRLSALVRKNKYIHRGTAMIAVGDQAYYGD